MDNWLTVLSTSWVKFCWAYMRSTPSLRDFLNVAFKTVPMFTWLSMALSRPFKEHRPALPLFTPISSRRSIVWCTVLIQFSGMTACWPLCPPVTLSSHGQQMIDRFVHQSHTVLTDNRWLLCPLVSYSSHGQQMIDCFVHQSHTVLMDNNWLTALSTNHVQFSRMTTDWLLCPPVTSCNAQGVVGGTRPTAPVPLWVSTVQVIQVSTSSMVPGVLMVGVPVSDNCLMVCVPVFDSCLMPVFW